MFTGGTGCSLGVRDVDPWQNLAAPFCAQVAGSLGGALDFTKAGGAGGLWWLPPSDLRLGTRGRHCRCWGSRKGERRAY